MPMPVDFFQAVHQLVGGEISGPTLGPIEEYKFHNGQTPPTQKELEVKLEELLLAQPIRHLRERRNVLLAESDWWAGKDVTMSQARKDYRQKLRDLPASANPMLDENDQLTNVTWPTKPE